MGPNLRKHLLTSRSSPFSPAGSMVNAVVCSFLFVVVAPSAIIAVVEGRAEPWILLFWGLGVGGMTALFIGIAVVTRRRAQAAAARATEARTVPKSVRF